MWASAQLYIALKRDINAHVKALDACAQRFIIIRLINHNPSILSDISAERTMLKNEVIRRAVKEVLDKYENVLLAYLSGSIARSTAQSISDVDVAVLLKDNSLEKQADILWKVAKALHVFEDRIDLVDLNQADLHLKYNILREGIKLIDKGFEEELIHELIENYPETRENLNIAFQAWLKEDPRQYKLHASQPQNAL